MKSLLSGLRSLARIATSALLLFLTACSFHENQASIQPVGPAPPPSEQAADNGYLVVYSAWSNFVDPGSTGHHSRYTVTADDGSFNREVINHVDRFDEGPIRLPLKPGAYHVRARSAHFGRVNVPIVIEHHLTTYVYLDGKHRADGSFAQGANAVKLPNGEIVGWSATVANSGSP